jgi:hypothetical protein
MQGQCHCGALRARFTSARAAAELQARSCPCSFCLRHGAVTVRDPEGRSTFRIGRAALVTYRFATRGSKSLPCGTCGVYAGAILEDGDKLWSVVNVRVRAIPEFAGRIGEPAVYDGETPEGRVARRKRALTPAEIVYD